MYTNVIQMLEATAARLPDKPAYVSGEQTLTYKELMQTAKAYGTTFARLLPPRTAIAVFMGRTPATMAVLMGAIYAGCFAAALDPSMPADRAERIFTTLKPGCVVADASAKKLPEELNASVPVLYSDTCAVDIDEALIGERLDGASTFDPIQIFYLSDASGVPKGIVHTHQNMLNYTMHTCDKHQVEESQNFGNQAPFFYATILWEMYPVIYTGATCYFMPGECFVLPGYFMEYFQENKISTVAMTPKNFNYIADSGVLEPNSLPDLVSVYMVGEVIPYEKMKRWREAAPNAVVMNFYASTETPYVAEFSLENKVFKPEDLIPVGKPFDAVHLLLLDENGDECAPGQTGEMYISSPWISCGYYNDPQRTKKSFVQNPLDDRWQETFYRSGDLGRFNENGELCFMGRRDTQIKHKGYRMDLGETETALASLEGWEKGCCLFDEAGDKIYCFFTGALSETEIKKALPEKLDKYMMPDVYVPSEALPLTNKGRIDRAALKKQYFEA